jgi:hypothetical protein
MVFRFDCYLTILRLFFDDTLNNIQIAGLKPLLVEVLVAIKLPISNTPFVSISPYNLSVAGSYYS